MVAAIVLIIEMILALQTACNEPAHPSLASLIGQLVIVRVPGACVDIQCRAELVSFFRDDVNNAADGITSVKSRPAPFDDFDALDVLHGGNTRQVCTCTGHGTLVIVDPASVYQDDDTLIAIKTHHGVIAAGSVRNNDTVHMQCH